MKSIKLMLLTVVALTFIGCQISKPTSCKCAPCTCLTCECK